MGREEVDTQGSKERGAFQVEGTVLQAEARAVQRCCDRTMLGKFKGEQEGQWCRWDTMSEGGAVWDEARERLEADHEPVGQSSCHRATGSHQV